MFENVTKSSQAGKISRITISVGALTGIFFSVKGHYGFWKSAVITGTGAVAGAILATIINTVTGKD